MSSEYERLLREYNIPAGVLSQQELRMLKQGGIRLDQSDGEDVDQPRNRPPQYYPSGDLQIESVKQIYENKLSMKDKQIDFLQAQLSRRDQLLEAERQRVFAESQLQRQKLLSELNRARAKVIHSEGQIPLIKESLSQVREMLSGMRSQSVYLRLREVPDRQLPPSQWLLVNVWEIIYPYKKEAEICRRQTEQLREEVKQMNDKQNSLLNELQHYSRLLSSKDDDFKRHTLNYDNNRKCMELQLQKLREECQLNKEKGARYDELLRDYQFTKQEKELMEQKLTYYDKETSKDTGLGAKFSQEEAQRRKMELLSQDKEYLTKENIQLIQKNKRLQDRLDRLEAQLLNQKNRSQEYLHQLLNLKTDAVSTYQQKIYREISSLKDTHRQELEMAKNNLVDIYQKQIQFLKETQSEKDIRLEHAERELREKSKDHEHLLIQSRSFQRKFDGDLAQTRVSLKIKSEQLDRVNNIYQETLGNLKAHKIQNQMLRQKLNCLKGQYYKAQANNKDQMSSLKAQVAVLRQQLANYQIIEKQIDEAVISLGNLKPNNDNIFTSTLHSMPSSNQRRIQQALGLAQRLQAKQRQHEQTQDLLRNKEESLEKAEAELKVARSLLDKTNQPYSYLVTNIQEKEREIIALRNQNRKINQQYEDIKAEYRQLKRQLQEAQKDIQRLLVKRESIQNIQSVLIQLSRGPTTATQVQSAIENIKDILGTSQSRRQVPQKPQSQQKNDNVPGWYKKIVNKKQ